MASRSVVVVDSAAAAAEAVSGRVVPTAIAAAPPPAAPVPFPRSQQRFLLLSALACLGAHVALLPSSLLLLNLGLLATTLGTFSLASTLTPPAVQVYLHPFLQCSAATWAACAGVGALTAP